MSDEIESPAEVFEEYDVPGVGTVIAPEGEPGYRVRLPDGRVTAFPADSGQPSPENAEADIEHAIENPPPIPVPTVVSRARFLIAARRELALTEGAVFALISQIPDAEDQDTARDLFENATEFRRGNPMMAIVAGLGNYSESQIDEVFRAAAALQID